MLTSTVMVVDGHGVDKWLKEAAQAAAEFTGGVIRGALKESETTLGASKVVRVYGKSYFDLDGSE